MKRYRICLFLICFIFFLSACSPNGLSAQERAQMEQFNEWQAQAEEIAPLLKAPLYDTYDIEISVLQPSGSINVYVEVLSVNVDRCNYGTIIGILGDRFLELADEYGDYSFGDITFFYYYTNSHGRKRDSDAPSIVYTLKSDGSSTFLEPDADVPELFDKAPMDIYYWLTDNSQELPSDNSATRSIPNPTLEQKLFIPSNSFEPVDKIIFSTTASENGLEDTPFYVHGTIEEFFEVGSYNTFRFSTDYGDLYISEVLIPFPELEVGDHVTVFFLYGGWSKVMGGPSGPYVYHE